MFFTLLIQGKCPWYKRLIFGNVYIRTDMSWGLTAENNCVIEVFDLSVWVLKVKKMNVIKL